MRVIVLGLLALTACHRHLDLGSKPHLLGKLADIDFGMSQSQMTRAVPEIADTADAEPSAVEYDASFDHDKQVENVRVRVARPVDDLFAAWGPGTAGSYGGDPARIYVDPANGIRYVVRLDSSAPTGNSFSVIAMPMRPLAKILDDGPDLKMFGLDLLGSPRDQALDELKQQGIPTKPWSIDAELAKYFHTDRFDTVGHSTTEVGEWSFQLAADQTDHLVTRIELDIEDLDRNDEDEKALLDRFAHKWGTPTRSDLTLTYPVKDHKVTVTLGYKVELVIADTSKGD